MRAALRLTLLAPLLAMPGLLPAPDAAAQGSGPGMIRPQQAPQVRSAPAPALPGISARPSPAPIPPGEGNATLSPNAALFDAIARGDLAAARDAVSRGADLSARNALGLSPIDAAVDQGRHEIAFYLLSARDMAQGGSSPPPAPGPLGLQAPPPDAAPAQRPAANQARRDAALTAAARASSRQQSQPSLPRSARLWANDGGAPQPDIGFLGFDAGRPPGATPPASAARRGGRG
ncbi:ankyrin repeat domain-containing protein [Roseomonas sp. AR75]|uniref:ankyrin repeat domain-containing protein n=1 Tax=Roseomonas sp. AR75 TaxID=2562311 RepID=UPI001484DCE2|nr:ankyrin repeat domain-containing protein [Roseomonas sp. AR75]